MKLNLDNLLAMIWKYLCLVRIYTKRRGEPPDFTEPIVLTEERGGTTVHQVCDHLHRDMANLFKWAMVWGTSVKHFPQKCGLKHCLEDEDVIQVLTKTAEEQRQSQNYAIRVQEYYDKYHQKKQAKANKKKLKT